MKCPNPDCGYENDNEGTICWKCKAPLRGQSQGKRVRGTRELEQALKSEKFRCEHGVFRVHPCEVCGRDEEGCLQYRGMTELEGVKILLDAGVTADRKEALLIIRTVLEQNKPS